MTYLRIHHFSGANFRHTNASTESSGVFRVLAQSSGSNCTDLLDESDLGLLWADQEWHFVAMSYDYARGLVSVYMDDRQHYSCDDQANAPIVDTLKREDPYDDPYIMVGNSDKPSDTAYTTAAVDGAFNGSMDDIRFYTVPLTEAQIDRVRRNSPAQPPTDIADSLYAWFNFATGAHTGDVQPVHNHGIRITTGQGINVYKPRFVVSDAPIPGLLQETTQTETETETESETQENEGESAVVLVQRRQAVDEGAPTAMRVVNGGQGMTVEFKIKFPYPEANFLYTVIEEPHASLNVTNAPDAGTFTVTADNGTASELDTVLPVQGLGTSLTFTPNASFYGNLSYTVRLTTALLSDGAGGNSSQPITLRIEIEQAVLPLLGSGGRAIRCDGVNDYMYAPYFEWPLQNYTDPTDNISRFGGGPITIEGWMYLSSDSSAYGTLASIGKGATPYRSYAQKMLYPGDTTGRLEFSMPTGSNRQVRAIDGPTRLWLLPRD
ncbi:hypothetical protein SARC_00955 [Sphaeroforma arctica JP610]|uniref:Uncharacterized protein n=1 Tax=Sphaeroforma arctica JP610 TaxID=667725 RepID=A0A0L0GD18_9EUKA|nr:hypothetical protein SARC_00955 [Sphaeroforma arctica JP610]KNC86910.1 hypothetical protein SARC_00955 [Sphaeroforma arctica JP610]|eukprot:XP_014160812.1 hypothetical protein SARC_00955 [Sphaeroforma arctica JP610]